MSITYMPQEQRFLLQTENTAYSFCVEGGDFLRHEYYGEKTAFQPCKIKCRSFSPYQEPLGGIFSLNTDLLEFPFFGSGDYRCSALKLRGIHGDCCTLFSYENYRIFRGRETIPGLPYARPSAQCETLELTLRDPVNACRLLLYYTVFPEYDLITRHFCLENRGEASVKLEKAMCLSLDLPGHAYSLVSLPGAYAYERSVQKTPLGFGTQQITSRRGMIGHQQNPFMALVADGADEEHGYAYGFNLVYSGSFLDEVEVDFLGNTRVNIGLGEECFAWLLGPGERFCSPEAYMVCSAEGLGGMSRRMHAFIREQISPPEPFEHRPVVLNPWESCNFDIDEQKLLEFARQGKACGADMLVVDDGWFGERNMDNAALGDWYANRRKFPEGLASFAHKVVRCGLRFGIWIEPEMINPDSDLYRAHPDWCLSCQGRTNSLSRNQLVLDLCNPAVLECLKEQFTAVFDGVPLSYIKWDCNRNLSEVGSPYLPPQRQDEAYYRYQLGVYALMNWFRERYPGVMIENCSGGGGRYDPAMMAYSTQIWTSDNTEVEPRVRIQYGTSLAYPASTMSCHVSDPFRGDMEPHRRLQNKYDVSLAGMLGYELDLPKMPEWVQQEIRQQIIHYRQIEELVKRGDLYRLVSPFENSQEVAAYYYTGSRSLGEPAGQRILLSFLQPMVAGGVQSFPLPVSVAQPDAVYRDAFSGETVTGAVLRDGYTVQTDAENPATRVWLWEKQ